MKIEAGHDYVARDGERWTNARRNLKGQWELTDAKGRSFWFEDDGQFGGEGEDCRHNLTPPGPVRTITRKEIVPGVYGRVEVVQPPPHGALASCVKIGLHYDGRCVPELWVTPDELRAAAATLTEIADAIGEAS